MKIFEKTEIFNRFTRESDGHTFQFRGANSLITKPNPVESPPLEFKSAEEVVYPIPSTKLKIKSAVPNGLFRFNVWFNGSLRPCYLIHERDSKGHFQRANDFEASGFLDNGTKVRVCQDEHGKLYAVTL